MGKGILGAKRFLALLLVAVIVLFNCKGKEEDSCEEDKIDGDWEAIATNSDCSSTERAEAYLALGGFNFFDYLSLDDPNLASILRLNGSNWQTKKSYFDKAANLTATKRDGTQKTIYLFGTFLGLYSYVSGKLDNGTDPSNDARAFDGELASSEIEAFTGSGVTDTSDDSTEFDVTTDSNPNPLYQFKISNVDKYFLYNSTAGEYYEDASGDGIVDNTSDVSVTVGNHLANNDIESFNQIMYLNSLTNPLAATGNVNPAAINTFANSVYGYLENVQTAIETIQGGETSEAVEAIEDYKGYLDNGGQCKTLNDSPGLRLIQYFNSVMQDASADDYSGVNVLSTTELSSLGEKDASADIPTLTFGGTTVSLPSEIGIKVVFKHWNSGPYLPFWKPDSTTDTDVKDTMTFFNRFDKSNVKAGDHRIVLSEILCVSDVMEADR